MFTKNLFKLSVIVAVVFVYFLNLDNSNVLAATKSCSDYEEIKKIAVSWDQGMLKPLPCSLLSDVWNPWRDFFAKPGEFSLNKSSDSSSVVGYGTPDMSWEAIGVGPGHKLNVDLRCFDGAEPRLVLSINGMPAEPESTIDSYFWGSSSDLDGVFKNNVSIANVNKQENCDTKYCGLGWEPGPADPIYGYMPFNPSGITFEKNYTFAQLAPVLYNCAGTGGEFKIKSTLIEKPELNPELNLYLDPQYILKTKKERFFRPTEPFSPYDDIICELKTQKGKYPTNSKIVGTLETVGEVALPIIKGGLVYDEASSKADKDYDHFQWKITGWPESWIAKKDRGEDEIHGWMLMELIAKSKKVNCKVNLDGLIIRRQRPVNTCVRLEGDKNGATFGITTIRTKGVLFKSFGIVDRAVSDMNNGYKKIDPFKTESRSFYFEVDLNEYGDTKMSEIDYFSYDIESLSSCKESRVYNMYTFGGANGSAILGKKKVSLGTSGVTATVRPVHETAHAFCKLDDEYVYSSFRSTKDSPNCFNDLSKIPDAFADYGRPFAGCLNDKSARTSYSSIMGTGTEDEAESRVPLFNVWDCGACLREIYWGEGKIADYAKKCRDKNMDTANPTQKPHPEDYGWNCFSDKDCPGYKNLKWSPDCVSTCVSNKCTVNDGKTCDPKSFKIVEDENGKYQTIYDKPGKCGSKDKGTEGQCVPLPPPECVSDKDCNSSSKTDFQCKNECSSGKCTNTAGTACITEDSSLTLTGKKGKCGSKASGTAGQCVLVK